MFYNDILIANIFLRLEGLKGKNDIVPIYEGNAHTIRTNII